MPARGPGPGRGWLNGENTRARTDGWSEASKQLRRSCEASGRCRRYWLVSLNWATSWLSPSALLASSWADAAICSVEALVSSVDAETCSVVAEDCSATEATSPMFSCMLAAEAVICWAAAAICSTRAAMSSTEAPICRNASRVCSTTLAPSLVLRAPSSTTLTAFVVSSWIAPISPEISCAACWDSSASFLTSSATTAKPRPCSPARAASIAAFSASRLVCSAMPVIVATIAPICSDLAASSRIAVAHALAGVSDRAHRLVGLLCRGNALLGDLAGPCGDFGGLLGLLGALVDRRGDFLGRPLGALDQVHLALGSLGHVADRLARSRRLPCRLPRRSRTSAGRPSPTLPAACDSLPTSSRRLAIIAENELPRASRSERGSTSTLRSPSAMRPAAATIVLR